MKYLAGILLAFFNGHSLSQSYTDPSTSIIRYNPIFADATFDACHAATIAETDSGTFIAAWFAGSYEGANDVEIWAATYRDNKWSKPIAIAAGYDNNGNPMPCWNPVLFRTSDGTLILFYKVGPNPREWWGEYKKSYNEGKSWSKACNLPCSFLGPIKNKPIQLENGNILCPSSVETASGMWSAHLEIANKDLTEWKRIEIEKDDSVGVIQPTIISHPDGRLQMLCRSRQNLIYETWSEDDGRHWSKLYPTNVPNPNSGIDAVSLQNGQIILAYNPLIQGKDWFYGRNVLNIAVSDDGIIWKDIYQLENETDGEFSYPAVIQASDKKIHVVYTALRKTIKHVILLLK